MTDTFKTDPFANYTLEDIIRYLATWDLPEDHPSSKVHQTSKTLKAILLLCQEWSRNEG